LSSAFRFRRSKSKLIAVKHIQLGRDLRLSSLKRYVEASGEKVRSDIELPDGHHYQFRLCLGELMAVLPEQKQ
jgi:hypothetical protein